MTTKFTTFFVLNGFLNGEEGVRAERAGDGNGTLHDGWYYIADDDNGENIDGTGPYPTKAAAERAWAKTNRETTIDELTSEVYNGMWVEELLRKAAKAGLSTKDVKEVLDAAVDFIDTHHLDSYPGEYTD